MMMSSSSTPMTMTEEERGVNTGFLWAVFFIILTLGGNAYYEYSDVMLVIYRVPLSAPMLLFPVFLFLQILFTIGAALILSTGTAFFRDIKHLLEVALSVMFWTTPIVYELKQVSAAARGMILLSPMSSYIAAYHEMFYYREWPDASIWLVAVAYALISMVIGTAVFVTYEDQIAEYL